MSGSGVGSAFAVFLFYFFASTVKSIYGPQGSAAAWTAAVAVAVAANARDRGGSCVPNGCPSTLVERFDSKIIVIDRVVAGINF